MKNNMERKFYHLNEWYPVTDDEYWVEEYPEEFPNCHTVIYSESFGGIYTQHDMNLGWSTMAKAGSFKFMIIENPKA